MADISIALSSFDDFTAVNVEGLGVIKVRKESSNQGLRQSENTRDIFKLQDESRALDISLRKLIADGKTEDDPEIIKLEKKGTEKLDRITEARREIQMLRKSRLSDDDGGALVERLFEDATDEDISKLLATADGLSNKGSKDE